MKDQDLIIVNFEFRITSPIKIYEDMARDTIILECTEAREQGVPPSRYVTTRNKKSLRTPGRLEKVKYNPFLKKRTLHRELR
tara:strand:+ start:536 stop:781 length:246 start_codon:yes stop_codon:yes gene_type:complete